MILIKNKKAYFEYTITDKIICGIVLKGSEVKAIKNNKSSISESYCYIFQGEVFIKGMFIGENVNGKTNVKHEPLRDKKLLLNKKEILKLEKKTEQKGFTLIPLNVILNEHRLIKIEIGVGKGKNLHDKKMTTKLRDLDRDLKKID